MEAQDEFDKWKDDCVRHHPDGIKWHIHFRYTVHGGWFTLKTEELYPYFLEYVYNKPNWRDNVISYLQNKK